MRKVSYDDRRSSNSESGEARMGAPARGASASAGAAGAANGSDSPPARRPLPLDVADIIRNRIVEGDLAEGQLVAENELCSELTISRTPVREALKILASEGLITIIPHKGSRVTVLTIEEARDMLEFLAEVEGMAAELAAKRASANALVQLRRQQDRMARAHAQGDMRRYFKINIDIHHAIVEAAANATLAHAHATCSNRLRRVRYLSNNNPTAWAHSIKEHEDILQALERRASAEARALMTAHVSRILPDVAGLLRSSADVANDDIKRPYRRVSRR